MTAVVDARELADSAAGQVRAVLDALVRGELTATAGQLLALMDARDALRALAK